MGGNGNIGTSSLPKTSKTWASGLRALIDVTYKKKKDYRVGIIKVDDTDLEVDRVVEMGGSTGAPERRGPGEPSKRSTLREGYEQYITQVEFDDSIPVDYQQKKFQGNQVRVMQAAARNLAMKFYKLEQKAPFSLLNYGFQTTNAYLAQINKVGTVSALLPDGKRLFSSLHQTFPDNTATWSNLLTTADPVSEAAADLMLQNLYNQPDDDGEPKNYGEDGVIWLVPRTQYKKALEIVSSDRRSGTGDNDANILNPKGKYNGFDIEVRTIPWLSNFSGNAHFMIDKNVAEQDMPLMMLYSDRFYTDQYEAEGTKTEFVRGQVYFGVVAASGRGMVGSPGDSITVSY